MGQTEVRNKEVVRTYYTYIDSAELDQLYTLFDNKITYEREGTGCILGLGSLRRFYKKERVIESGTHINMTVRSVRDYVATEGDFVGVLKNGDAVNTHFFEKFWFGENGKIVKCVTTFGKSSCKV